MASERPLRYKEGLNDRAWKKPKPEKNVYFAKYRVSMHAFSYSGGVISPPVPEVIN